MQNLHTNNCTNSSNNNKDNSDTDTERLNSFLAMPFRAVGFHVLKLPLSKIVVRALPFVSHRHSIICNQFLATNKQSTRYFTTQTPQSSNLKSSVHSVYFLFFFYFGPFFVFLSLKQQLRNSVKQHKTTQQKKHTQTKQKKSNDEFGFENINEFHNQSNETIEIVTECVNSMYDIENKNIKINMDDFDYATTDGVLNIYFGKQIGTWVLNKQTPNQQLWLSSPISGPHRYDWNKLKKEWQSSRDQHSLKQLLHKEFTDVLGCNHTDIVFNGDF